MLSPNPCQRPDLLAGFTAAGGQFETMGRGDDNGRYPHKFRRCAIWSAFARRYAGGFCAHRPTRNRLNCGLSPQMGKTNDGWLPSPWPITWLRRKSTLLMCSSTTVGPQSHKLAYALSPTLDALGTLPNEANAIVDADSGSTVLLYAGGEVWSTQYSPGRQSGLPSLSKTACALSTPATGQVLHDLALPGSGSLRPDVCLFARRAYSAVFATRDVAIIDKPSSAWLHGLCDHWRGGVPSGQQFNE